MSIALPASHRAKRHKLNVALAKQYDLAVIGAGPVGSLCALAHARRGARVALLGGNPKASTRLAGEWLHPIAATALRDVGIDLEGRTHSSVGNGFLVFPEDGTEPIELRYPHGARGLACEHAMLVNTLQDAVGKEASLDFYQAARALTVEEDHVLFRTDGVDRQLTAERIVGADGRGSIVRRSLGLPQERVTCSRMVGCVVEGTSLPQDGYGHVVLGGPGPILMFNLGTQRVRIIVDVPLDHWAPRDRLAMLVEAYAALLPEPVRSSFVATLRAGNFQAAGNELQPRLTYGNTRRVLIGDAAGHYHPLTAIGMTLGFGDALALAESNDFESFKARRLEDIRAPEILALGLYEVFADQRPEAAALRQAIYRGWRTKPTLRERTMNFLSGEDKSVRRLALTFFSTMVKAIYGVKEPAMSHPSGNIARALAHRVTGFIRSYFWLQRSNATVLERLASFRGRLQGALLTSLPNQATDRGPGDPLNVIDTSQAIARATESLLSLQKDDGSWEGEMVWCPMLSAQYVLLNQIMGRTIDSRRQHLLLRNFERTRFGDGTWGLHEHSEPYLFVTTLVYVAARLLDLNQDDPLISRAKRFIRAEGVLGIPSWGKFWLALLNLYDWRGLNPVLPELWLLPRELLLHPSNWYCHTRLIYMAMATVSSHKFQVPVTKVIAELRRELYTPDFETVDFTACHGQLREGDLFARPSRRLRMAYWFTRVYERFHNKNLRARSVAKLTDHIRWELASSSYTSISPVSGFLNILALYLENPNDEDCSKAEAKLVDWMWEDEHDGTRVTGARSASWDTGFALQALASVREQAGVQNALKAGAQFLQSQQIPHSFEGFQHAYRNDPNGGWCFAGVWHGWPVTDCTAEAILGLLANQSDEINQEALRDAIDFMLRGQNRDGGFGSYESRRSRFDLEWLNPAEMFGESMTERSYVECTASCLAALAACGKQNPTLLEPTTRANMHRAEAWLRHTQASDGSWRGVWGVQFIYGTFFGIRGLIAAGARTSDPALRQACRWLLDRQHTDGGWGEHHSGNISGRYVPHTESQVIQTAWALIALLEAGETNWTAITAGAKFLIEAQYPDGTWPRQDMAGVFFRTALLEYALYRQYFPLHALGLYEQRRRARLAEIAQQ